jgi:cytidine deaminase
MKEIDFDKLYSLACEVAIPRKLTDNSDCGGVGAVLLTESGNIYKGVCIDTMSSMGFCAEHAAAGAMVTAGENHVVAMVAVNSNGEIYYPCGRCREFINQLHYDNINAQVMVGKDKVVTLKELLPYNV